MTVDVSNDNNVAAIAPWFRLRLPSCGPGSNPKHTIYAFFNLYYWNCIELITKIKKTKRGRDWPLFLKKVMTINYDPRVFIRIALQVQIFGFILLFRISFFKRDSSQSWNTGSTTEKASRPSLSSSTACGRWGLLPVLKVGLTKAINKGLTRPLFVSLRPLQNAMTSIVWKRHSWYACDSNPGLQDGRQKQIHWDEYFC